VDEALNGYEAYSLLKTGRDEWGNPWPVTIRGFNDFRRPAIVYTAIPFVALLGLNTFAIRATAALWGWLGVVLAYRLGRDMLGRGIGLLFALMLAISPWHTFRSRMGMEYTITMLSIMLSIWCGWRWFKSRRTAWLIATGVAFGLSLYTYSVTQAFTPLMLAACAVIFARPLWQQRRTAALALALCVLISLPLVYALLSDHSNANRLDSVTVLRPGEPLTKGLLIAARQWLGHFSPDYLFLHGDASLTAHPPGFGQLVLADALLLPLGVLGLARAKKWREGALIIAWIALGAIPAALTVQDAGTAHSGRGMIGVPAYALLSAVGVMTVWSARRIGPRWRMALAGALAGLVIWNSTLVMRDYFVTYPVESARAFEYGVKEAIDYVTAHESEYDAIVLTDWISQPHIFALFFQRVDPARFQALAPTYGAKLSVKLKSWGKYQAADVDKLYPQLEHGLFVARPHMLAGIEPVWTINHPDGSPAFKIIK
jgi:4-amino-4-deoxy-L-arabinose transferase-like glycosyltransferase